VERGRAEAARIEAEKLAAAERKRKAEERKAQTVIDQIPDRAEREARAGRNHAVVYGLNPVIQDWHDGCGMDGGYNIVIHW